MSLALVNGPRTFVPPPPYRRPARESVEEQTVAFLRAIAQDKKRSRAMRANAARLAEQLEHENTTTRNKP